MNLQTEFLCFFLTLVCILIYLVGMHGHLSFRVHKSEDWLIWGSAFISFVAGVYFLVKRKKL
jgi:hypothetical protein